MCIHVCMSVPSDDEIGVSKVNELCRPIQTHSFQTKFSNSLL